MILLLITRWRHFLILYFLIITTGYFLTDSLTDFLLFYPGLTNFTKSLDSYGKRSRILPAVKNRRFRWRRQIDDKRRSFWEGARGKKETSWQERWERVNSRSLSWGTVSPDGKSVTDERARALKASLREPMLNKKTSVFSSERHLTGQEEASKILLLEVESTLTTEEW
jgi:hypothetical protein